MNEILKLTQLIGSLQSQLHLHARRLTTLESRQCSDSHAPSSAGSGGTANAGATSSSANSGPTGSGSPATIPPTSSATGAASPVSDSARRALADNNRPAWLTREAASTLPEGTERVYKCSRSEGDFRAYPGRHFLFTSASMDWSGPNAACDEAGCIKDMDEVYHLPPPAKGEGDAWSRWRKVADALPPNLDLRNDFNAFVAAECERAVKEAQAKWRRDMMDIVELGPGVVTETLPSGHVRAVVATKPDAAIAQQDRRYANSCRIDCQPAAVHPDAGRAEGVKPPKEIEAHAEALGWTPESRVWKSSYGTFRVNPSGKALDDGDYIWNHPESDEKCKSAGDTLLPNQAPKPSPGEVAEGIVKQWSDDSGFWPYGQYRDPLIRLIESAIASERNRP